MGAASSKISKGTVSGSISVVSKSSRAVIRPCARFCWTEGGGLMPPRRWGEVPDGSSLLAKRLGGDCHSLRKSNRKRKPFHAVATSVFCMYESMTTTDGFVVPATACGEKTRRN